MFAKNFYCISSRIERTGQFYGCFKIGPFSGHQSWTFANALRRTLLADTSKCVVDALQISGIEHEYSSFKGVRESVVDIILNLEKCVFQITRPMTKPQVVILNRCGPGIIRAQHLHLPPGLRCIDPSQYIATLEVDGRCTLKLFFSPYWKNFRPFDRDTKPTNNCSFVKKHSSSLLKSPTSKIHSLAAESDFMRSLKQGVFLNCQSQQGSWSAQKTLSIFKNQQFNKKHLKKNKFSLGQLQKKKFRSIVNFHQELNFQNKTQENFLFLQSSRCSVEKVNYTLRSQVSGFSSALFPTYNKTEYSLTNMADSSIKQNLDTSLYFKESRQLMNSQIEQNPIICEEEFIFFEVWTDGSCHPQVALLKAMNEILLDFFSYSLEVSPLEVKTFKHLLRKSREQSNLQNRQGDLFLLKEDPFREKFLNLEIGNFYFDLETYIFLKKKSIHRIIDFLNFFQKNPIPQQSTMRNAIQKFQKFLFSQLQIDSDSKTE